MVVVLSRRDVTQRSFGRSTSNAQNLPGDLQPIPKQSETVSFDLPVTAGAEEPPGTLRMGRNPEGHRGWILTTIWLKTRGEMRLR